MTAVAVESWGRLAEALRARGAQVVTGLIDIDDKY
jgi:hypothetical protein